ncbi:fimbrial protein [Providencia rettgeri]|nr:fimbrial protein [Providencia rettgeri]EJD6642727.1 fimbrial protein [Providencia rettgeri]ELL9152335.1 fimbrial protein [Providencia rettgeri]ELR5047007.1 fimbrial protein [Providencia rettgeri]ELR5059982.1 fimbrial protein [Providencia rettgeri]
MTDLNKQRYLLAPCLAGIFFTSISYAGLPDSRMSGLASVRNTITPGMVTIPITGVVLAPPPCVINNNQIIKIDFKEVMSTRIDGLAYAKPVNYNIDCSKRPTSQMKMSLIGNPAIFDTTGAVATNIPGLGIGFRYNGNKLHLNEEIKFVYPNAPQFEAVPVRDLSKPLTQGGAFQAGVTIKLDYQ